MDLLAELGFTDYRFSIEWARIEPARGEFSNAAIAHYSRMVEGAIERGLRPMLTLHHFTCPRWFDEQGGWDSEDAIELFGRFVEAAAPILVPTDAPGFKVGKKEKKTGIRGSSTVELILENVRLGDDAVLGELDRGFPIALDTLDGGRIGIGSQAVGIGRACLEASLLYAKQREQFGVPIGKFQAIQWKLADMSAKLDAARMLVHHAAWLRDRGESCSREAAQAKLLASQAANFCADECLQIHGGAGYTDDFHVERLFRDARITEIYEGVTDIQRLVIARNLLQ
jgi:alkylation response protein AidB-like acyl-CoA dehydrogenase